MLDITAALTHWQPLSAYRIDERTGEGPEILLAWTDPDGAPRQAIGVGFRHWSARANREELLFAVNGSVNRRVTAFRHLGERDAS